MLVRTAARTVLFESYSGGDFTEVKNGRQCIGCGAAIGRYIADWVLPEQRPVSYTRTVAAFLIKQAKDYDNDCGGLTDIVWDRQTEPLHWMLTPF